MAEVNVDLDNVNKRIDGLRKVSKNLMQSGLELKTELKKRWLGGVGADDASMPALSDAYKAKKQDSGRAAIRNLSYTGEMHAALTVRKVDDTSVLLYFAGSTNLNKARGNAKIATGMMEVSETLAEKIIKGFFKRLVGKGDQG